MKRLVYGSFGTGLVLALGLVGACHCGSDASGGAGRPDAGAPEAADGDVAVVDWDSSPDRTDAPEADSDGGPTTWWDDPAIWSPLPGGERCNLYLGDLEKAKVPPRVWTSCGPGCLEAAANLNLPIQNGVNRAASSGSSVADQAYFRLAGGWEANQFLHIARITDGATIALVARRNGPAGCGWPGLYSQGAALFMPFLDGNGWAWGAWVAASAPHPITWARDWVPVPGVLTSALAWDSGWAMAALDGTVRVVDTESVSPTTVAQSPIPVYYGTGRDNVAIWSMFDSSTELEALWGYAADTGARRLVSQTASIGSVAMDDDRMAWIARHGPQVHDGLYEAAELCWSPRTTIPEQVQVHVGPALPASCWLRSLAVAGDFAVTIGCSAESGSCDACQVIGVRLSSGQLWKIPMRPGKFFSEVLTATSSEVLLGEFDYPGVAGEEGTYRRLVRLEFSHLDELEHAW